MRRRKHRFPISSDKTLGANNAGINLNMSTFLKQKNVYV